jgi:signal transduction histidine kinase
MRREHPEWPTRERWIDVAWAAFSVANLAAMVLVPNWETVPFHFIWVSLTVLYGFRVWRTGATLAVLAVVMVTTGSFIAIDFANGAQPLDELTEVPLMAAMFLAMVWHARRRLAAMAETERVSMQNLRLLERERRFVQDASHELRTPITVALGHAELIQRQQGSAVNAEDAAVVMDELMRLRRLADRLLLLAGTEDPALLHLVPVDVEGIVMDALRRWAATPRRWVLGSAEEAIVRVDAERLEVAFDALIENAVQHTQEGDTIEVGVRRDRGSAIVSFRDTGEGIAPADLDRIFERFARADPGRSRHTGGFGLGLPIVQAIVEGHGGKIDVQSVVGRETTFRVTLPLTSPEASPARRQEVARATDPLVIAREDVRDPAR